MSDVRKLALQAADDAGLRIVLPEKGTLVVGSSKDRAGFVLEGQGIDDAHCAIGRIKGGGWALKDLGSAYGSIVNGQRVGTARLAAGDELLLGSRRVLVLDAATPAAAPAPPTAPVAASAPEPAAKAPRLPERIGGYRVEKLLGRGGMGQVLLAMQENLNRPVALKVLDPKFAADSDFVARFQSEARSAAALHHPNVTIVHDVGEADGFHFLAMEFMAGGSLEDRVAKDGPLRWREVLDVLHDAARGLVYAEEKGIVHRDIKPANLMWDATGTIKIADLGLATTVEAEATQTEGRKIFGTPHFISPEQARGEPVDARSDLYSLGATAYRLLTGHTLFEGETTRDILRGHFTEEPKRPRDYVPDLPDGVEGVVLKLLAKAPAERYATAGDLLKEVDRLRLQADHGPPDLSGADASKSPLKAIGLGVAAVAVVVVLLQVMGGDDDPDTGGGGNGGPVVAGGGPDDTGGGTDPTGLDPTFLDDPPEQGGPEVDPEQAMHERELTAENAYLRVPQDLATEERITRLLEVRAAHPGTTTATNIETEVEELRQRLAAENAESEQLTAALRNAEAALLAAAEWPPAADALPRPGNALRQILAFEPAGEVAGNAGFTAVIAKLEAEVVDTSHAAFTAELERAAASASTGDFDDVRARLDALLPLFDLPKYETPERPAPPGLDELRLLGAEVRGRKARVAADEAAWRRALETGDRSGFARRLGIGSGVEDDLAALRFPALKARLEALEAELSTDSARARAGAFRADVESATVALGALIDAFPAGGWRRQIVVDSRGKRATVLGVSDEGLVLDEAGNGVLHAWNEYAASPDSMQQLFKDRLARDYTAAERVGVRALLKFAGAVEAVRVAAQKLEPERSARFSASEAEDLGAAFDHALAWAGDEGDPALEREREAAVVLARSLLATESEDWTSVVAGLERLFADYDDTLLVTLLSDGTEWRTPEQLAPVAAPPEEPAPEDDGANGGDGR
jgi:hypothetical protein